MIWISIIIAVAIGRLIWVYWPEPDQLAWASDESRARMDRHEVLSAARWNYVMEYGLEPTPRQLWDEIGLDDGTV